MKIAFLVTLDTKAEEANYFTQLLTHNHINYEVLDLSITSKKTSVNKKNKMSQVGTILKKKLSQPAFSNQFDAYFGLGGGTGCQMICDIYSQLSYNIPKILLSPFPNDPRYFIADNNIILIPSLCDLIGLNPIVKLSFNNAINILKGFKNSNEPITNHTSSFIGVTALGVTDKGVKKVCQLLKDKNHSISVIHSNGFGGRLLNKWAKEKRFIGVIDYTIHELTFKMFGNHLPVPAERFSCLVNAKIPQVVLPGAINFHTRNHNIFFNNTEKTQTRYYHSPLIDHILLTDNQIKDAAEELAYSYSIKKAPVTVLFPMQGFSSEDCTGGKLENIKGRQLFLSSFKKKIKSHIKIIELPDHHINDSLCAQIAVDELHKLI